MAHGEEREWGGGGGLALEEPGTVGVEFLSGDVMSKFWEEGDQEVVAAAKKKKKKKGCPNRSQVKKKK